VTLELPLWPEVDVAMGIQSDVRGPQALVRLSDVTYGVLNCARSNGPAAGCDSSMIDTGVFEVLETRRGAMGVFSRKAVDFA